MKRKLISIAMVVGLLLGLVGSSSAALANGAPPPKEYNIGWLMVIDWDSDYPAAPYYLSIHPDLPLGWTITYEAIWFDEIQAGECLVSDFDLIVTTGHAYYQYTADQRIILEEYIRSGGILWIDDCGDIEIDNLPFGYEIGFGTANYPPWGEAYNSPTNHDFTIDQPTHPLMDGEFEISDDHIRDDRNTHWFNPFVTWDSHYEVVMSGVDQTWGLTGPAVLAAQVGYGKIVATAMDVTCAMEYDVYGGAVGSTRFDFHLVFNMLAWSSQPTFKNYTIQSVQPIEGGEYPIGNVVPIEFHATDESSNPVDDNTFFLEVWKGTDLIATGLGVTISNGCYTSSWDTTGMTEGIYTILADFEGYCSQEPVHITLIEVLEVSIDIKPGSFPNSINLGGNGVVPIAVLTTSDFDASTVNPATVELAGSEVRVKGKSGNAGSLEDVDDDGDLDLVVQVYTEALQLSSGDADAILTALTYSGQPITGTDSVRIVPPEQ
jgi:hypothetical protein